MTVTDSRLENYISALTEDTTPDTSADMLMEFDASASGMKKLKLSTLSAALSGGIGADGWATADAMTYASADSPTFTMTCSGDQTGKYSPGMRIKLTQTTVKYFIITEVAYTSSTTITLFGGTDYTLANAAITSPYYSSAKAPFGFPLDPAKWEVKLTSTAGGTQNTPTQNTWYNTGGFSITIPIGCWEVDYQTVPDIYKSGGGSGNVSVTLSTANNSQSDSELTATISMNTQVEIYSSVMRSKHLTLAAKTTYYLNLMTNFPAATAMYINTSNSTVIRAVSAYL